MAKFATYASGAILVDKFATYASGAIWWPYLQLMLVAKFATNVSGAILLPSSIQVTESISGSVVPLAMFQLCSSSLSVGSFTIQLISKSEMLFGFVSDCQIT